MSTNQDNVVAGTIGKKSHLTVDRRLMNEWQAWRNLKRAGRRPVNDDEGGER